MSGLFTVIEGEKDKRTFVCPFCASAFLNRTGPDSLDEHWEADPRCKRNAMANNPTQSKYGMAAGIENIPGEPTLNRIRQEGCEHPENLREGIYPDTSGTGPQQGYRCGYCYTEVYFEPSAE